MHEAFIKDIRGGEEGKAEPGKPGERGGAHSQVEISHRAQREEAQKLIPAIPRSAPLPRAGPESAGASIAAPAPWGTCRSERERAGLRARAREGVRSPRPRGRPLLSSL